jgi:C_GCAxxG_C_C family probable redox protein
MSKASEAAAKAIQAPDNCVQAVFNAFCVQTGLNEAAMQKLTQMFGQDMERTGGICGAVKGAYMVLSMRQYPDTNTPEEEQRKFHSLLKEFNRRFIAMYKATNCKTLLGCDISTPERMAAAKTGNKFSTICPEMVASAVKILEEMG